MSETTPTIHNVRASVVSDLELFTKKPSWPASVIDELPGEHLKKLLVDISALEQSLKVHKRAVAQIALRDHKVPAQAVALLAKASQQTVSEWKREALGEGGQS